MGRGEEAPRTENPGGHGTLPLRPRSPQPGPLTCPQWRRLGTGCLLAPPASGRTMPAPQSSPWARPPPPDTCDALRLSCWRLSVMSLGPSRTMCRPGACAQGVVLFELCAPEVLKLQIPPLPQPPHMPLVIDFSARQVRCFLLDRVWYPVCAGLKKKKKKAAV